ncbi:CACTA en-spm transposon protein [Cucumis melo var. makuwa]|uniref:CACTA en-spm transposon protein n=1 Tax=Cucumis melo var. makuwa TaxID=1194695 RepID=A0A5A7TW39_CUCMM|nr:CACTA en-spm transposon protein [Cucumis melo var. makuwa]
MSYRRNNFIETNDIFLEFEDNLDNIAGGSSSVGDNTAGSSSQQHATPTPRRRAQSRLLELERYVATNGCILMTTAPGAEKPISPHAVRFSQAIGVCVRKTFPIRCLKWADVGREYIEVVKGDLQMLTTFKEFWANCHKHFKKYSDPKEARANPPNALVAISVEQSRTNKAARQKQPYNHSSRSKSFLQRQYELLREKGSRSIVWSCFGKDTFGLGRSCRRASRMRIIKCWNSNPSLPQRVVSHSLRMRYAIRCCVDD